MGFGSDSSFKVIFNGAHLLVIQENYSFIFSCSFYPEKGKLDRLASILRVVKKCRISLALHCLCKCILAIVIYKSPFLGDLKTRKMKQTSFKVSYVFSSCLLLFSVLKKSVMVTGGMNPLDSGHPCLYSVA